MYLVFFLSLLAHILLAFSSGDAFAEQELRKLPYKLAQAQSQANSAANERLFWESVKDSKDPEEFKVYLDQFPNGVFATLARTRIKALQAGGIQLQPDVVPSAVLNDLQSVSAGTVFRDCPGCPEMVVIPPGNFLMGGPSWFDESWERPQHSVTIEKLLAIGKFEVTRGQFAAFANETGLETGTECSTDEDGKVETRSPRNWRDPGFQQQDNHPVVCISWNDAKAYSEWLSRKVGKQYRLLTEAEWEYAARAGTTTLRYWGDDSDQACGFANIPDTTFTSQASGASRREHHRCSDGYVYTAPVGSFKPNAFGLYDMIGNAWEMTEDCFHNNYDNAPSDGSAWIAGGNCGKRVIRGGSWNWGREFARSFSRWGIPPSNGQVSSVGFRVARAQK